MQMAFGSGAMSSVNSSKAYIDVALFSATRLKPPERFFIPNYKFLRTDRFAGRKNMGNCRFSSKTHYPQLCRPPTLVSIEATGVCIPTGNSEVLFAAVYKSPGHAWSDADIIGFCSFRRKSLLAGEMNAKFSIWDNLVSNDSDKKLLNLLNIKRV
jgi:hypothetical protein